MHVPVYTPYPFNSCCVCKMLEIRNVCSLIATNENYNVPYYSDSYQWGLMFLIWRRAYFDKMFTACPAGDNSLFYIYECYTYFTVDWENSNLGEVTKPYVQGIQYREKNNSYAGQNWEWSCKDRTSQTTESNRSENQRDEQGQTLG